MKYIDKFDVTKDEIIRVMDSSGKIINKDLMPEISLEEVLEAYKIMNLSRSQDIFQNLVQRQGRLLSFLSSTGQEACEVAYSLNLIKGKDWFVSGYRNNAAWITCGVPIKNVMLYWAGNEYGAKSPDGVNVLPPNIVIGSQYSHATGLAFAEKYKGSDGIALTVTGDGGMSEGEVFEAMNFAKIHESPVIFVCENNQWAISTPRGEQTKSLNFAIKSVAVAIPSLKVDGNDFLACYGVFKEVSQWVREGKGPFFVECETYRLGPHSSADNPDVYRDPKEFEEAKTRDPLVRLKAYLIKNKIWSDAQQEALDNEHDQYVKDQFTWMEQNKEYPLEDIFDYTFAKKNDQLEEQYLEAKRFYEKYPNSVKGGH